VNETTHGIKFNCQNCKKEIKLETNIDQIQIVGGVRILCSGCKKITVYLGTFGNKLGLVRAIEDIENVQTKENL
jgi:hypothetical protein